MTKKMLYLTVISTLLLALAGCNTATASAETQTTEDATNSEEDIQRPEGWTDATHGNDADPDYDTVFPQDEVNRIDITISAENWEAMLADMTDLYGEFGTGSGMGGRPDAAAGEGNGLPEARLPEDTPDVGEMQNPPENFPGGGQRPDGQNFNGGGLPGGMMNADSTNPIWITADIEFEGGVWTDVGIRFKGNSSLKSAWSSGNLKLPFKLDFDQFEDDYPEIDDQRFYGFKQLSLANNFNDDSYLREKVTADVFRDFGVASAHTAFYEVYVDYGEGPVYFGLYTMVEMVEDTVISEQFESDEGNLYKPEGSGATFAEGSFNEASFDKETNQDEANYADIQSLFTTLHADTRMTNAAVWRNDLEAIFDVDGFLRWLAVNTVVQNWDTYGLMSHNYFLYTDPETDLITWIPWDNNHALSGGGMRNSLSLSLDEVTDDWPLIRYLMDDPVYQAQYETYVAAVMETAFVPDEMAETYQTYHALIADSVLAETDAATTLRSKAAFEDSVQDLIDQVNGRYEAVQDYLSQ
jgi:hypothetical protein